MLQIGACPSGTLGYMGILNLNVLFSGLAKELGTRFTLVVLIYWKTNKFKHIVVTCTLEAVSIERFGPEHRVSQHFMLDLEVTA